MVDNRIGSVEQLKRVVPAHLCLSALVPSSEFNPTLDTRLQVDYKYDRYDESAYQNAARIKALTASNYYKLGHVVDDWPTRQTYKCAGTPTQKEPTEVDPNRCVTYVYDHECHRIKIIRPAEPEE